MSAPRSDPGPPSLPREVRNDISRLPPELRQPLLAALSREPDPVQLTRTALSLAGSCDRRACQGALAFLARLEPGPLRRWWLRAVYDLPDQRGLLGRVVEGFVAARAQGAALEFCRKASRIVRPLDRAAPVLLELVSGLAGADPKKALDLFLGATEFVSGLSPGEKRLVFSKALALGPRPGQVGAFLGTARRVLAQAGPRGLAAWLRAAREQKPSAREAFLSFSSPAGRAALDRIAGGVSLEARAPVLELYARSLGPGRVVLADLTQAPEEVFPSALACGARTEEDGLTRVFLPARERSARPEETYRARLALVLAAQPSRWEFLLTFSDPWLAADLWALAAELRAGAEIVERWPGLGVPLAELNRSRRGGLRNHPVALNPVLKAVARRAWGGRIRSGPSPGLTPEEADLAREIYALLAAPGRIGEAVGEAYPRLNISLAGPAYQAAPGPPKLKFGSLEERRPFESEPLLKAGLMDRNATLSRQGERAGFLDNLSRLTEKLRRAEGREKGRGGQKVFFYPEWDPDLEGLRPDWTRVVELAREGPPPREAQPPVLHPALIRSVRRQFQKLRPRGLVRLGGQSEGCELDLEAAVSWMVDRLRGRGGEEGLYQDRRLKKRDVACAVLIDLSGSTGRSLGPEGGTVLEVAKKGLLVLAEALDSLGDPFALLGFSGSGRTQVEVSVIKDFGDRWSAALKSGLGGLAPGRQNRDGAALRHAAFRLASYPARKRILFFISDGRPDDYGYTGKRALEDTRAALKEAAQLGLACFGLTVDQKARDYVAEMMGSTPNLILDRVERLPRLLPRLYWRLAR